MANLVKRPDAPKPVPGMRQAERMWDQACNVRYLKEAEKARSPFCLNQGAPGRSLLHEPDLKASTVSVSA
jgi:hypothetical protein